MLSLWYICPCRSVCYWKTQNNSILSNSQLNRNLCALWLKLSWRGNNMFAWDGVWLCFQGVCFSLLYLEPNPVPILNATRVEGNNTFARLTWTNPADVFDRITITWGISQSKDFVSNENTTDIGGLTPGESYTFTAHVFSNGAASLTNTSSDSLTLGTVHQWQFHVSLYQV